MYLLVLKKYGVLDVTDLGVNRLYVILGLRVRDLRITPGYLRVFAPRRFLGHPNDDSHSPEPLRLQLRQEEGDEEGAEYRQRPGVPEHDERDLGQLTANVTKSQHAFSHFRYCYAELYPLASKG